MLRMRLLQADGFYFSAFRGSGDHVPPLCPGAEALTTFPGVFWWGTHWSCWVGVQSTVGASVFSDTNLGEILERWEQPRRKLPLG